ncbi:unnamed protein product [Rhizophagus irregularis]|nr:unnamed protein product [Rhizophagus irregularis]CAB5360016.1 unnamed protein product [Rhizophagus irregularis]
MNSEQGKRGDEAKLLYDDYKKESGNINEINSGINNFTSKKNEVEPVSKETEKNSKLQFSYHLVDIISKIYNKYARRNLIILLDRQRKF